jgi:hypothetical protein
MRRYLGEWRVICNACYNWPSNHNGVERPPTMQRWVAELRERQAQATSKCKQCGKVQPPARKVRWFTDLCPTCSRARFPRKSRPKKSQPNSDSDSESETDSEQGRT